MYTRIMEQQLDPVPAPPRFQPERKRFIESIAASWLTVALVTFIASRLNWQDNPYSYWVFCMSPYWLV